MANKNNQDNICANSPVVQLLESIGNIARVLRMYYGVDLIIKDKNFKIKDDNNSDLPF